ncbi:hypothetical protein SESBI_06597 [Sesbania bispinosa]|nr:hypothetical protein SESBI_06597 [Sesbania bispinosa]
MGFGLVRIAMECDKEKETEELSSEVAGRGEPMWRSKNRDVNKRGENTIKILTFYIPRQHFHYLQIFPYHWLQLQTFIFPLHDLSREKRKQTPLVAKFSIPKVPKPFRGA